MQPYLGQILRELREAAGLVPADLETLANRRGNSLGRFEKGEVAPYLDDVDVIVAGYADALGIRPSEIYRRALDLYIKAEEKLFINGDLTQRWRAAQREIDRQRPPHLRRKNN